jgi:hypothetical protein
MMEEIRQKMFSLDEKINFTYVKDLTKDIKALHDIVKKIEQQTQKKWWQFWK